MAECLIGRALPDPLAHFSSFTATRIDGTDSASEPGTLQPRSYFAHLLGRSSGVLGADRSAKSFGRRVSRNDRVRRKHSPVWQLIRQLPPPLLQSCVLPDPS